MYYETKVVIYIHGYRVGFTINNGKSAISSFLTLNTTTSVIFCNANFSIKARQIVHMSLVFKYCAEFCESCGIK